MTDTGTFSEKPEMRLEKNEPGDKRIFFHSLVFPVFFVLVLWSVKIIELGAGTSFYFLGIYPLKVQGLIGIVTAPLIHENFKHLLNNSIPLLILATGTFYFYRPLGYKIFFLTWLMTDIWVWCGAREAYHIGASGIVYGLASFLFFSGIFRRTPNLAAVSLIVVFLYGSMIWGIFPFIPDISWESHLSGGVAGLILAFLFRQDGPQPKKYDWEFENDLANEEELQNDFELESKANMEVTEKPEGKIVYLYKPHKKQTDSGDETV